MFINDPQICRIQHQIATELDSYDKEIRKLSVFTYPSGTSLFILKDLERRALHYRNLVDKILNDYNSDNPQETKAKLITKAHNPLISQDVKFLDWIRNAQTANVPWSFVPCIEDLAEKVIPGKKVLVFSENRFNYGMCWSLSEGLAPHPYYILALPRSHRTNILWHCSIGHELFHPRCCEFINSHNAKVLVEIKEAVSKEYVKVTETESDEKDDLFSEITERERLTRIAKITDMIHLA
jgi:hypothetical protein